jgi:putative nucleotidyltransferase with HDIG domain
MKQLTAWARAYILGIVLASLCLVVWAFPLWKSDQTFRFLVFTSIAFLASGLRVTLPGISGGISVNFVFVLIGNMDLSLPQVLCLGFSGTLGQFVLGKKNWHPIQLAFNLASVTLAVAASYEAFYWELIRAWNSSIPILLICSAAAMFFVNTLTVSGIIAVTEGKSLWRVWHDNFLWTGSHHLVGAAIAAAYNLENRYFGWEAVVLTVPVVYFVYRSYALHLGRLEAAKQHTREIGELHWRAIEALALAIDAKDETTHNHLLRVKVYATEIARELKMPEDEMQALQAAALLHDIGKLAVPEYIISKPGKLTREEFEKMKIHPVVGAEILDRVRFPYPVVPIVRAHHEKWDGTGYPAGLAGEAIPLGARILAAVDCLDALASDRQYRRALPLDSAMEIVARDSGTAFDPQVVAVLQRRYIELEKLATSLPRPEEAQLSKNIKIEGGSAPGAGFAESENARPAAKDQVDVILSVESAVRELRGLLTISEGFGAGLSTPEMLCLLATRLKRMVSYDTIAIFSTQNRVLIPRFTSGEDAAVFAAMEIPLERGLTGWVAENRKPIANGNPAVESGYNRDRLRSALSVPLESGDLLVGALTLYSMSINAFSAEDLHLMMAASSIFAAALAGTAIRGGQIKTPVPARKSDFLATPAFSLQPGPQPLIQ